jgi:hypothetical protein
MIRAIIKSCLPRVTSRCAHTLKGKVGQETVPHIGHSTIPSSREVDEKFVTKVSIRAELHRAHKLLHVSPINVWAIDGLCVSEGLEDVSLWVDLGELGRAVVNVAAYKVREEIWYRTKLIINSVFASTRQITNHDGLYDGMGYLKCTPRDPKFQPGMYESSLGTRAIVNLNIIKQKIK